MIATTRLFIIISIHGLLRSGEHKAMNHLNGKGYFFEHNLPIASICHGVEIPAHADCVRGRKMATVLKCKFDLEVCGGTFVNEACVIDGNLISGRTFHDHGQFIGPWIKLLLAERARRQK